MIYRRYSDCQSVRRNRPSHAASIRREIDESATAFHAKKSDSRLFRCFLYGQLRHRAGHGRYNKVKDLAGSYRHRTGQSAGQPRSGAVRAFRSDTEDFHQSAARWNIFRERRGREMRPGNSFKISFESRSENEGFARSVAGAFLLPLDPVVEEVGRLKTAVPEAVSNSVIHGHRGGEGTIYMECEYSAEGRVRICIRDEGVGTRMWSRRWNCFILRIPTGSVPVWVLPSWRALRIV